MESNRGDLCCQCVSVWHLEECLQLLGLLMVYDRVECLGEWTYAFLPVAPPHLLCNTNTSTHI